MRSRNLWLGFAGGLLVGALIILGIRFFIYKPDRVHYHANFAVYINGQREQFSQPYYYEEEGSSCTEEAQITPPDRAHMHDNVNSVIHIHDHAVTWEQFFNNIGWDINTNYIKTRDNLYVADSTHKITFILNGAATDFIVNKVIGDQDRLLVDYGSGDNQTLNSEFKSVPSTAKHEDESTDPASCGGSAPVTTSERLHHLF